MNADTPQTPNQSRTGNTPDSADGNDAVSDGVALEITSSRHFAEWLSEQGVGIAFTAPRAGKLLFVGLNDDDRVSVFQRTFESAGALTGAPSGGFSGVSRTLWLASKFQLWRLENVLQEGQLAEGYDRLYVPQSASTTGELNIRDIAVGSDGTPIFVNTLFDCIAIPGEAHSFHPVWRPPFLDTLEPADRCHLTGLAMDRGLPVYVSAAGRAKDPGGWKSGVRTGGCVYDIRSGEVAIHGLTLPHAPRVLNNVLWLLNSGAGYFGYVDVTRGLFEPIVLAPGFMTDFQVHGDFAVIALSRKYGGKDFTGLPVEDNLSNKGARAQCALAIVDLQRGELVHWMRLQGVIDELQGVTVLPGVRRAAAVGLLSDEICRVLSIGPEYQLGPARGRAPAPASTKKPADAED